MILQTIKKTYKLYSVYLALLAYHYQMQWMCVAVDEVFHGKSHYL